MDHYAETDCFEDSNVYSYSNYQHSGMHNCAPFHSEHPNNFPIENSVGQPHFKPKTNKCDFLNSYSRNVDFSGKPRPLMSIPPLHVSNFKNPSPYPPASNRPGHGRLRNKSMNGPPSFSTKSQRDFGNIPPENDGWKDPNCLPDHCYTNGFSVLPEQAPPLPSQDEFPCGPRPLLPQYEMYPRRSFNPGRPPKKHEDHSRNLWQAPEQAPPLPNQDEFPCGPRPLLPQYEMHPRRSFNPGRPPKKHEDHSRNLWQAPEQAPLLPNQDEFPCGPRPLLPQYEMHPRRSFVPGRPPKKHEDHSRNLWQAPEQAPPLPNQDAFPCGPRPLLPQYAMQPRRSFNPGRQAQTLKFESNAHENPNWAQAGSSSGHWPSQQMQSSEVGPHHQSWPDWKKLNSHRLSPSEQELSTQTLCNPPCNELLPTNSNNFDGNQVDMKPALFNIPMPPALQSDCSFKACSNDIRTNANLPTAIKIETEMPVKLTKPLKSCAYDDSIASKDKVDYFWDLIKSPTRYTKTSSRESSVDSRNCRSRSKCQRQRSLSDSPPRRLRSETPNNHRAKSPRRRSRTRHSNNNSRESSVSCRKSLSRRKRQRMRSISHSPPWYQRSNSPINCAKARNNTNSRRDSSVISRNSQRNRSRSRSPTRGIRSRSPSNKRAKTRNIKNSSRESSVISRKSQRRPSLSHSRSPSDHLAKASRRSRSPQKRKLSPGSHSKSPGLQVSRSRSTSSRALSEKGDSCISRRNELIQSWRKLNCKDNEELEKRLKRISGMNSDEILREESAYCVRSAAVHPYYERDEGCVGMVKGTHNLSVLVGEFHEMLISKPRKIRAERAHLAPPPPCRRFGKCKHLSSEGCSSSSDEEDAINKESEIMEELNRKIQHPFRLHHELWHNEPGEMNDGPLCKCSAKARRSGIRHGLYAGDDEDKFTCDLDKNNSDKLYHYRITISPPTNFLSRTPTMIEYDGHEFLFEGFSLFSHYKLPTLPVCKVIRFNIEYMILYIEEPFPENFTIRECDVAFEYLFREILELLDLDLYAKPNEPCPVYHFMPRFVREFPEKGHELLPMCVVLKYLMTSYKPLVPKELLKKVVTSSDQNWHEFADEVKGMLVTKPGMKPASIRIDQLDKRTDELIQGDDEDTDEHSSHSNSQKQERVKQTPDREKTDYPIIIHFGIRPPQLSYAGNQGYQKAWRDYIKHRHLIANLAKPTSEDKRKLAEKEAILLSMRSKNTMKRDVTVILSSKGFYRTGLMCDVVQHAMLIPVLVCHLRFHRSLNILEKSIGYNFKNRHLLQLALTHPSYRENFGTNPDHARNSLTNCGIRQPSYGDRKIHYKSTKKSGINTLIKIMSRFGSSNEKESTICHNERLEFLGDAVVEFVSTIHLFFIFSDIEEGGLATYRAALVQNQHLAILAQNLKLESFLLYAHASDLCHDLELKHALANCFEALMGALYLDGGIEVADKLFGMTLYGDDPVNLKVWNEYPRHPLQEQEPNGDRHWIDKIEYLKKLSEFENKSGARFDHIRLLARAMTDRSVGYTNLTLGSNQRLEFLGDSVLQLVTSEYLYKHFPEHHEGHLSLLRSSLVNNKTQSVVCDDLGLTQYACYAAAKTELKTKDKADLLEAFLGAFYVDKRDLEYIKVICKVCFFPRLHYFIVNQEWNDPKSKLQQCCLTLRTMEGGEPDIPRYKVVDSKGPTNARVYRVAVYFRGSRLGVATGHSIQQAEMNAAQEALEAYGDLFPQLDQQKRVIANSMKKPKQRRQNDRGNSKSNRLAASR